MKAWSVALLSGALFGAGLVVSGMTDPANVTGFLDFFGDWKPALAFVMAGAIGVHAVALRAPSRRDVPGPVSLSAAPRGGVDARLVLGAAVFGVGWGLSGFCPGPAIVSVGMGSQGALAFVAASVAGMLLADRAVATAATAATRVAEASAELDAAEVGGPG